VGVWRAIAVDYAIISGAAGTAAGSVMNYKKNMINSGDVRRAGIISRIRPQPIFASFDPEV